jgi:hypothetical protein
MMLGGVDNSMLKKMAMTRNQHKAEVLLIISLHVFFGFAVIGSTNALSCQEGAYKEIDRHALQAPKSVEQSIESLASYLIKPANNELERVCAIFRWITENIAYDTQGFFSGEYGDQSPEVVLKKRKAVCEGYARLFESLARAAGLEAVKIRGYAKGYSYLVSSNFDGPPNHTWNAIKINGQWHLLDCAWGAGYVNEQGQFVREFTDYFFLTPPSQFIYTHFPEDPKWQLLEKPISKTEWENLVYLRPAFFKLGLKLESHFQNLIQADGQIVITLSAPDDVLLLACLEQNNRKLEMPLTLIQREAGYFKIHAVFPEPGIYILRLLATRRGSPNLYKWALDYKVEAKTGMGKLAGFPKTYSAFQEKSVYLYSPKEGNLKSGTIQLFKLKVPGAESVIVINAGKWFFLKKQGEIFEGEVKIEQGEIGVFAKFPGDAAYTGLMQYNRF